MEPIHILLVEDNAGDVMLIKEAFKEARVMNDINTVQDGEKAIMFLDKKSPYEDVFTPDLILLDVNLPRINGLEVLSHIKESDALKKIPVIMLTTSSDEKDILESYKNYANCYITKPVDADNFMNTISRIDQFWIQIVKLPPNKGEVYG
ncbi:response regulator [Rhodohalobacter sp. 8-1]|uniref:response regulator n=1 Tax=Rhodohalobacter sp. 8-1 TaxID=3131972 RepID=UPI0030EB2848